MFGTPNFNYGYPWNTNQTVPQQPQQTNFSFAFIQGGEDVAKNYLVAQNQSVILIDNEAGKIFIKTTDASGMVTSFRKFDEVKPVTPQQMQANFVTRDEFEKRIAELSNNYVPTA